jgi:alpha-tubulin suppressor-like RCC1 family protein
MPEPQAPPPPRPRHTQRFAARQGFVLVRGDVRAVALAAGRGRSCAITDQLAVTCWGHGGAFYDWARRMPHVIDGTEHAASVAVAQDHACALLSDHSVRCWGFNLSGELGNGTVATSVAAAPRATPVRW